MSNARVAGSSRCGPGDRQGGFTLVEILIALLIGSILATTILAVVSQQGAVARLQGSREEVQQNGRGAIELLASEIRSLPREGLLHAGGDRMILRVPVAVGTLCTTPVPASGTIHLLVPSRMWSGTTADTLAVAARISIGPPQSESEPFPDPEQEVFVLDPEYATMSAMQVISQPGITAPCTALGATGDLRMLALTPVGAVTAYTAQMRAVAQRADMYLFDEVEYSVDVSTVPGQWIHRTARGTARALAGPLPDAGTPGLRFRYFAGNTEIAALPVTDPRILATITRIRVEVTTVGRLHRDTGNGTAPESRTLSTDVYLRNARGAT
jgi:prepilin-type N-terminal cleavage/methylation domain-containing protein